MLVSLASSPAGQTVSSTNTPLLPPHAEVPFRRPSLLVGATVKSSFPHLQGMLKLIPLYIWATFLIQLSTYSHSIWRKKSNLFQARVENFESEDINVFSDASVVSNTWEHFKASCVPLGPNGGLDYGTVQANKRSSCGYYRITIKLVIKLVPLWQLLWTHILLDILRP